MLELASPLKSETETHCEESVLPVSMDVRGAEGVAVVQQRGVDQRVVLWILHQDLQVVQVTVAAANAVPGAVLVQDEHLTGTEPTLRTKRTKHTCHTLHNNNSAPYSLQSSQQPHEKVLDKQESR